MEGHTRWLGASKSSTGTTSINAMGAVIRPSSLHSHRVQLVPRQKAREPKLPYGSVSSPVRRVFGDGHPFAAGHLGAVLGSFQKGIEELPVEPAYGRVHDFRVQLARQER